MKGFSVSIAFVIMAAVFLLLVGVIYFSGAVESFEKGSLELMKRFKPYRPYEFSISDLLVDPSKDDVFSVIEQGRYYSEGADPAFCQDLRGCIKDVIEKGDPQCVISYKVGPGVTFSPDDLFNSIKNSCPTLDIKEELKGVDRKICGFDANFVKRYNKFSEDNVSLIEYEPYIHNCYIPKELGTNNVLPDMTDQLNYLYSGRGTESGYVFTNGGTVRIVMTNFSVEDYDATCSYSLYVCGQNAIAVTEDETPVEIFKTVRDLPENEPHYDETIVWGGAPEDLSIDITWPIVCSLIKIFCIPCNFIGLKCSPDPFPTGGNIYGYYPRTHEFDFSGTNLNKEALIDAVDAGMWEWNKLNYKNEDALEQFKENYYPVINRIYFSYSPFNNFNEENSIDFNSACWNEDYETSDVWERTELKSDNPLTHSSSLQHIFNFDDLTFNINEGDKIRMVLGIKKIFITGKVFKYDLGLWAIPLAPYILLGIVNNPVEVNILDTIINKYDELEDDFESRVIMVLDPVTFCSG